MKFLVLTLVVASALFAQNFKLPARYGGCRIRSEASEVPDFVDLCIIKCD